MISSFIKLSFFIYSNRELNNLCLNSCGDILTFLDLIKISDAVKSQ